MNRSSFAGGVAAFFAAQRSHSRFPSPPAIGLSAVPHVPPGAGQERRDLP